MSDIIKLAFRQGVKDALVGFGLMKSAAPGPRYDNPDEDAPGAGSPKASKSLSDMSDSDIDAMVSKIPASKGSADDVDSLLAGLPPRGAKPPREEMVFTLDDYNLGDSPAPKKKAPSQGGGKVTYVNIPEYPEDVITAKKPLVAASGAGAGPKPLTTRRGGQSSMPAKSPPASPARSEDEWGSRFKGMKGFERTSKIKQEDFDSNSRAYREASALDEMDRKAAKGRKDWAAMRDRYNKILKTQGLDAALAAHDEFKNNLMRRQGW
jgi:hypothetical protein